MHASNACKQCTKAMPIRTDGRTYGDGWLSCGEILTFRNARAHIRDFPVLDSVRARMDAEAAS